MCLSCCVLRYTLQHLFRHGKNRPPCAGTTRIHVQAVSSQLCANEHTQTRQHKAPVSIDDCTALRRRKPSKHETNPPHLERHTTDNPPNMRQIPHIWSDKQPQTLQMRGRLRTFGAMYNNKKTCVSTEQTALTHAHYPIFKKLTYRASHDG